MSDSESMSSGEEMRRATSIDRQLPILERERQRLSDIYGTAETMETQDESMRNSITAEARAAWVEAGQLDADEMDRRVQNTQNQIEELRHERASLLLDASSENYDADTDNASDSESVSSEKKYRF